MDAYLRLGCQPTWTCAPYQAGHRPALGQHVAWGESNAVVFCNSVLGARTERYGDFLDICAALCGRAPETGLHLDDNRRATLEVDASALDPRRWSTRMRSGRCWARGSASTAAGRVVAFTGLPQTIDEDRLKAMGAAAASTGAVGLFHVAGVDAGSAASSAPRPRDDPAHRRDAACCARPAVDGAAQAGRAGRCRRRRQPAFLVRRVPAPVRAADGPQARDAVLCLHRPPYARRRSSGGPVGDARRRAASPSSPIPASS